MLVKEILEKSVCSVHVLNNPFFVFMLSIHFHKKHTKTLHYLTALKQDNIYCLLSRTFSEASHLGQYQKILFVCVSSLHTEFHFSIIFCT